MHRNSLSLALTLAALMAPAAFAMKYATGTVAITQPVDLLAPRVPNISFCSSDSNTIAVGYETYNTGGFRMLCADAGRIGFWTTPVAATLVGHDSLFPQRFLCPSSMALAGVQFIEGARFPFALCGDLTLTFPTGGVRNTGLYTVNGVLVQKTIKGATPVFGVTSCGSSAFIQSLKATRDAAGEVVGFTPVCNAITTTAIKTDDADVDLAVRTIFQTSSLDRNATQTFHVNLFNLGTATVPATNVTLELRYDAFAWKVLPFGSTVCTDILAHSGVVDRIVVGERCTFPPNVEGNGGMVDLTFRLEPVGPDSRRPATPVAQPIFSVKAIVNNENLQGADADSSNDLAAFPVVLK